MNQKLILRILGALSSALIIVSIFIPFISVSGYSQNLWEAYSKTNALYLPIMIIIFGSIGVLFFSLNIKTEIAYSTAGALLFYLISETASFIDQDMMSSLSVGYYCLVIGTLLTGIMAFLTNLKSKHKVISAVQQSENLVSLESPESIITKIDSLYNNPNETQQQSIQPIPNMPMQVQPIQPIPEMSVQVQPVQPIPEMSVQAQPVQPIPEMPVQAQPVQPIPEMPVQAQPVQPIPEMTINQNNNVDNSINPVVAEFSNSISNDIPVSIEQKDILSQTSNPVINEFNSISNTVLPEAPAKVEPKVEIVSNNLDIFN